MRQITAKIVCSNKVVQGDETRVEFAADYNDGRNKEWAAATPNLHLSMTLKGDVADAFEPGQAYTLVFEAEAEGTETRQADRTVR